MPRIKINGTELAFSDGQSVLDIAVSANIDIPRLCYLPGFKTSANCGLCVVSVKGEQDCQQSCLLTARDGMEIETEGAEITAIRHARLAEILKNHTGDCRPPCTNYCPAGTDCQGYIGLIANKKYREAFDLIMETNPFPSTAGRICPQHCSHRCRRVFLDEPLNIGALERFAGDFALESGFLPQLADDSGKKVALIGAGPSSLTAAFFLRKLGHAVEIFESEAEPGGMLRYTIPDFRLPKEILKKEISRILNMGVVLHTHTRLGVDVRLETLRRDFDAVFIGVGAWLSGILNRPGEELAGVYGGIEFLAAAQKDSPLNLGYRTAVIGGGNTAIDAARTALRLGVPEVYILYRRTREQMPAGDSEIEAAAEEGIKFKFLTVPLEIIGGDHVSGVKLQKMRLGEMGRDGRRMPIPIADEEEFLELSTIIVAAGQKVDTTGLDGIALSKYNTIIADKNTSETNLSGVFAAGDACNDGPLMAIDAIAGGAAAARSIAAYLDGLPKPDIAEKTLSRNIRREDLKDMSIHISIRPTQLTVEERNGSFAEVINSLTEDIAENETSRCMECGCLGYHTCKLLPLLQKYQVIKNGAPQTVYQSLIDDSHQRLRYEQGKCIKCGICAGVCAQPPGRGCLTLSETEHGLCLTAKGEGNLASADCSSCMRCVSACPTGALSAKIPGRKPVPVKRKRISFIGDRHE